MKWFSGLGLFFVMILSLSAASVAGQPKYFEIKQSIPPVRGARLFIYRVGFHGGAWHPDILLNGKLLFSSISGSVVSVDVPPGSYEITAEDNTKLKFRIYEGEIKYINLVTKSGAWRGYFMAQFQNAYYGELNMSQLDYQKLEWRPN